MRATALCDRCGVRKALQAFARKGKCTHDATCRLCRKAEDTVAWTERQESIRRHARDRAERVRRSQGMIPRSEWLASRRADKAVETRAEVLRAMAARFDEQTDLTCVWYDACLARAAESGARALPCAGCERMTRPWIEESA
jgi:hypothetical protein